ncbi:MAG: hypothetical protein DI539_08235 [Flavobacterium psychrophilum]|nr:MAG: hypothetical protein DI539_08235 [Flavobacterium psychrophilum]
MATVKTLILQTLLLFTFYCSAQEKKYPELKTTNPVIDEAFAKVYNDAKRLPTDKMIHFINIVKKGDSHEIWITLAGKDILPYMLSGKKYKIAGYNTFNNIPTIVIGENYQKFFSRTGKEDVVPIKDIYPPNDENVLSPTFETFRWVFTYKNKKLEFIHIDYEYPF